jgi:hypothetical protein
MNDAGRGFGFYDKKCRYQPYQTKYENISKTVFYNVISVFQKKMFLYTSLSLF